MQSFNSCFDVAVIGGGPVGCVTALNYAQQGAQVLLLEAHAQGTKRLAGEWLHPPAVKILQRLGVTSNLKSINYPTGKGFVVFPGDGTDPIQLHYPGDEMGLSCEHNILLAALRETVAADDRIQFLGDARVTSLEGQQITFEQRHRVGSQTVLVNTIVGADGRASIARKSLGIPHQSTPISAMAGLLLEDVEVPFEGFGHVILGSLGPVLMYRITDRLVRVCLDVPQHFSKESGALWDAYHAVIPESLQPEFKRVLNDRKVAWAANQSSTRIHYGRSGLALVGDATGYFHPITATGMTVGFLDSDCLVQSQGFEAYQHDRTLSTYVPELLATSLYEVFTKQDETALALRQAIYQMWRADPQECHRTMQLLSGAETNLFAFLMSFLKGVLLAVGTVVQNHLHPAQWGHLVVTLAAFTQWLSVPLVIARSRLQKTWGITWPIKLVPARAECLESRV